MGDVINPDEEQEQIKQGQEFIAQAHAKMNNLVHEFARGKLNRTQFHQLYDRYQRQITRVAELIIEADPMEWRAALEEDEELDDTVSIRKKLTAKAIGVAVYDNVSGIPIEYLGTFDVDPALLVPMLSSYRSATAEIFRAEMRGTQLDNDRWVSFVPGEFTTLIALFTLEPSDDQRETIERMHRDFETANRAALQAGDADPSELAYPFLAFVKKVGLRD